MPTTVNAAFQQFNNEHVSLDSDRAEVAKKSRDWLLGQLISLPTKETDFPSLYDGMHIHHGSFSRKTKIRPLDDIDLILTFSGNGATYDTIIYGRNYILRVPYTAPASLRNLCNSDMTLNSTKLINKVLSSLSKIEQYKAAETHKDGEAATLQLSSYEWTFDIIPGFYTDTGYYIIPDGKGGWKGTDPRIDNQRINKMFSLHGDKVRLLIRKAKYWNSRAMMKTIPSYLLENIVLNFCDSGTQLFEYVDVNLINFWNYLTTAIYGQVPDPKGFQGDLNTLTIEDRQKISEKARNAAALGYEAYIAETQEFNHAKAISKWRAIFGDNFPKHE